MPLLTSIIAASRRRVDPDAADYFARIVAAGSTISEPNKAAVNAFVAGCKADGIWAAIKASCLLAGPDDLTGALVPLVGAAPTNFNFVAGDYNRVTGLVGNGSSKRLGSGRASSNEPQNNRHVAVWESTISGVDGASLGDTDTTGRSLIWKQSNGRFLRAADNSGGILVTPTGGFVAVGRINSSEQIYRFAGTSTTRSSPSESPNPAGISIFARGTANFSSARISFYSIGESLDLALLDARLATYMSALT
jgi:hypothetical protein